MLFAVALTVGAVTTALAQSYGHRGGGGRGGAPHMSAPRMPGPRMGGANMGGRPVGAPRYPWGGPVAGPPVRGYPAPNRGGYMPPGRVYGSPPTGPWAGPRPGGGWSGGPVYASPPGSPGGYRAPAGPARGWRRGGYLPPSYPAAVVQDFGRYHLRRPPAGYNWVREGNEFLLVSAGTGLIFDVVPAY